MIYREWKDSAGYLHKEWTHEDKRLHRESGPAKIKYNPDGLICLEQFWVNGKIHRDSGPAQIWYNPDGSIDFEQFFVSGYFLGNDKVGFWALWKRLDEEGRNNSSILKYLARYS